MEIVFIWIIFSFVAGGIGSGRKIGFWGAFFLSLVLSPLIGLIVAISSTKNSTIAFQKKMLESQRDIAGANSFQRNQTNIADELALLEREFINGTITVYEYDERRAALKSRL